MTYLSRTVAPAVLPKDAYVDTDLGVYQVWYDLYNTYLESEHFVNMKGNISKGKRHVLPNTETVGYHLVIQNLRRLQHSSRIKACIVTNV